MTQRKNKAVLMLLFKIFSVILMIGLLTSCGYNKNFSDPDHEIYKNIVKIHSAVVPETWQTQSRKSHISSLSWNDFSDPRLTYLIKQAFLDNLTLRDIRLRLKNAHISLEQAQERVTRATQVQYETGVVSAFDLIREQGNELRIQQNKIRNWQAGMRISANILVVLGVSPDVTP